MTDYNTARNMRKKLVNDGRKICGKVKESKK